MQLIQHQLGISYNEAKDWAKNFLQDNPTTLPSFSRESRSQKSTPWQLAQAPSTAPRFEDVPGNTLHHYFREDRRHSYTNAQGQTLFYNLRLSRHEDGKKSFLPLSYGHQNNEAPQWSFRRPSLERFPVYKLHQLTQNPQSPILIVEGEKTAEAAQALFPDRTCITWIGGASSVEKTDWSVLKGRDVLIWPDNDTPGKEASEKLCALIRRQDPKTLKVIRESFLKNFPHKWDLADALPETIKQQAIQREMICADDKISPRERFLQSLPKGSLEEQRAREILYHLEDKHLADRGLNRESTQAIQKSFQDLLKQKEPLRQDLLEKHQLQGKRLEEVLHHIQIHHIQKDHMPSSLEISQIKESLPTQSDELLKKEQHKEPIQEHHNHHQKSPSLSIDF